ncbi:hypothetical protein POVWA2_052650 [Plasmodium ovale wallikeri]|uniref:Uncharacterized protein n=1 Tax=Plasmodium ovale wallikeri TaxID=864142 RepID=A0A1A8ZR15_PLAOA|nr:hypothetical protein POVWA1_053380 [Plasmodium ovale wallikeri]SBT46787.1 hypothetical protein POVWA2_052650 [Plasmodium ovale wallikeri]
MSYIHIRVETCAYCPCISAENKIVNMPNQDGNDFCPYHRCLLGDSLWENLLFCVVMPPFGYCRNGISEVIPPMNGKGCCCIPLSSANKYRNAIIIKGKKLCNLFGDNVSKSDSCKEA